MTPMSNFVHAPEVVRKIDWIDVLWPLDRRGRADYPQVQKYCLTGMAGSYTDFHIDFGGTSVWYHVVWGCKHFYLIRPTCANLRAYEQWSCSPNQDQIFLGDLVDYCYQVDILPGQTFFIPSGWIHAVYTPEDSLVFGGNFLHCFAMLRQLQADSIERRTRVAQQYRFPHFQRIHWYALITLLPYALQRVLGLSTGVDTCPSSDTLSHFDPDGRLRSIVSCCEAEDFFEDCTQRICNALFDSTVVRQLPYVLRAMEAWLGGSAKTEAHSVHDDVYSCVYTVLKMNVETEPDCLSTVLNTWWRVLSVIATGDSLTHPHLRGLHEHIDYVRGLAEEECDWLNLTVVAGAFPTSHLQVDTANTEASESKELVEDKSVDATSVALEEAKVSAPLPAAPMKLKLVLRPPQIALQANDTNSVAVTVSVAVNDMVDSKSNPASDGDKAESSAHASDRPMKRPKTCTIKQSVEFAAMMTQADSFTLDGANPKNTSQTSAETSTPEEVGHSRETTGKYSTRGHRVSAEFLRHATDIDVSAPGKMEDVTKLSLSTHDVPTDRSGVVSRKASRRGSYNDNDDAMEDNLNEDADDDDEEFYDDESDGSYNEKGKTSTKAASQRVLSTAKNATKTSSVSVNDKKISISKPKASGNSARQNILKKLGMKR